MRHGLYRNPRLRFIETPVEPDGGGGGIKIDEPPAKDAPADKEPAKSDPLGEPGLKALQAERERASKAEKALADLQKQVEDAGKTAEQKASDALAEAQHNAQAATLKALQYEIAAEKGIDLKLATRLVGATREEIAADADNLKTLVGAKPASPKPDPTRGGGSDAPATGVSAGRDLFADRHPSKKK